MHWWSPPKQRQRWEDSQVLPSGNWGQIFFDLFYVGGCINLGNVLMDGMSSSNNGDRKRAILYFLGAGFPIIMMWFDKLWYDARFTTKPGHDVVHRVVEALEIGFVATALSRMRSVEVLSNSCKEADMFQFSLALLLNSTATLLRYLEVRYFVIGEPAAKVAAIRDIACRILPMFCFLAATIDSGYYYFSLSDDNPSCEIANDRPLWYCLGSWLSWAGVMYMDLVVCAPKQRLLEITVPMNIHFCIHRYGEWFMLMFGESVISLLIVDGHNEASEYSLAFYAGILSVIFLAHLHYGGQPHDPDRHALSRSRHSSYVYTMMMPIHSLALIAIGVSYKLFLYEFTYKYGFTTKRRELGGYTEGSSSTYYSDGGKDYEELRHQSAADLFSASMAVALLCMDFQQLLHRGLPEIRRLAQAMSPAALASFVLLKYSILVVLATLSIYKNDPHFVPLFGLGAVMCQELLATVFSQAEERDISGRGGGGGNGHDVMTMMKTLDGDDNATWISLGTTGNSSVAEGKKVMLARFERDMLAMANPLSAIEEEDKKETATVVSVGDSSNDDSSDLEYSRMAEF